MVSIFRRYFLYLDRRFRETLRVFVNISTRFIQQLSLQWSFSKEQINFLDVNISQKEGNLQTELYCKSTDTHRFLHFRSCCPYVYKTSMPYGQAIRMKRICSNEEKLSSQLEDLEHWLCSRSYKKEMVHSEIQKNRSMNRGDLLKKREKQYNNDSLTLVLTYHTALNKVQEILKKAHRHTIRSPRLSAVLTSPPQIAFRNPKTLEDHLVRSKSKIRDSNDEENRIYKCGNINCDICNILYLSNEFQSTVTERRYHISFKFDYNSINVIYLLTCKRCRKQYVGSTVAKFRLRFNQYKSNIKLYGEGKRGFKQEKLIEHFFCPNHSGTHKDISVQIIITAI